MSKQIGDDIYDTMKYAMADIVSLANDRESELLDTISDLEDKIETMQEEINTLEAL